MTEAVRFQTRARTVDHLGREQIADCPTAISELWKNSYDAYAKTVSFHIFDGAPIIACICDDGHGMSREEFVDKWLVIGTESKAVGGIASLSDRNGLPYRKRQGKKGIGRLSAAYLANFFLLVTKRLGEDYVAALIDWRIFENPFLILDDIRIPVTTFKDKHQLFQELPKLYDTMMSNLWGDPLDAEQQRRVTRAWMDFDDLEASLPRSKEPFFSTTSKSIEHTLINEIFSERHLAEWEVWANQSDHGTAMVMAGVIHEVEVLVRRSSVSGSDQQAVRRFRDTLWCFVDPFIKLSRSEGATPGSDFTSRVIAWHGDFRDSIIEHGSGFESNSVEQLEHTIDGEVDEQGIFRGRVKAFGAWINEEVVIEPAEKPSKRADLRVGKFTIYIAAMEFDPSKSTHIGEQFEHFIKVLNQYNGLMVFRDGFRVMPYGRADADYFGIETRRGLHAGREFWDHHNLLGRIAISDFENPNLKDKAGREGLIDNRASKTFRALVIHILKTTARRYFGTDSQVRKDTLPIIKEAYDRRKKEEESLKLVESNRKRFLKNLRDGKALVEGLHTDIIQLRQSYLNRTAPLHEEEVMRLKHEVLETKQRRAALRLGSAPAKLPVKVRAAYDDYRQHMQFVDGEIRELEEIVISSLERLNPSDAAETIQTEIANNLRRTRRRLSDRERKITHLLEEEKIRIHNFILQQISSLECEINPFVDLVRGGNKSFQEAVHSIDQITAQHDLDNSGQLDGVIETLESLSDNINLHILANVTNEDLGSMRRELDKLNSLAQLGVTVEIIDHELESFTSTIGYGLKGFPPGIVSSRPYNQVKDAYEALTSRLRFLSPLKLSGEPAYRRIWGREIIAYAKDFFRSSLEAREFSLESTEAFDKFSVFEQPARVLPVFINLINNARYWAREKDGGDNRILLAARDGKIIVADSGPGVPPKDVEHLFRLFFSNRQGGRGVGLYLCRANLAAGGHRIYYATDTKFRLLSGANFVIEFREASFT